MKRRPLNDLAKRQFMVEQKLLGDPAIFTFRCKNDFIGQVVTKDASGYNSMMLLLRDGKFKKVSDTVDAVDTVDTVEGETQ